MKKIVNLTPHAVNIYCEDELVRTIESSGIARAAYTQEVVGNLEGIPIVENHYGSPTDLPEPKAGTVYIVSALTADAARRVGRTTADLFLTGELVRDEDGRVIGCRALCKF